MAGAYGISCMRRSCRRDSTSSTLPRTSVPVWMLAWAIISWDRGTEPDPSISDAVCAIVYAAPRTELKELQVLREILMHKVAQSLSPHTFILG